MDFADATLVYLAERESIRRLFTVGQKVFAVYRIGGKKELHLLLYVFNRRHRNRAGPQESPHRLHLRS